jgi:hypothetical protein
MKSLVELTERVGTATWAEIIRPYPQRVKMQRLAVQCQSPERTARVRKTDTPVTPKRQPTGSNVLIGCPARPLCSRLRSDKIAREESYSRRRWDERVLSPFFLLPTSPSQIIRKTYKSPA